MKKKYIYRKFVKDIDLSELDLVNQWELFGEDTNHDDYDYEVITESKRGNGYYDESDELKIDDAISALNALKEKGANYVQIVAHVDHHGYEMYGLEMREATPEEVSEFNIGKGEYTEQKKLEKIAQLEKDLAELKK